MGREKEGSRRDMGRGIKRRECGVHVGYGEGKGGDLGVWSHHIHCKK